MLFTGREISYKFINYREKDVHGFLMRRVWGEMEERLLIFSVTLYFYIFKNLHIIKYIIIYVYTFYSKCIYIKS